MEFLMWHVEHVCARDMEVICEGEKLRGRWKALINYFVWDRDKTLHNSVVVIKCGIFSKNLTVVALFIEGLGN